MKLTTLLAATVVLVGTQSHTWAADANSTAATKPKSTEAIECSKQADAKGLHGEARKEFRSKCKKDLKAKAAQKSP